MNEVMPKMGQKILTVDDDPDILKLLGMRLKAAGHQVVAVTSGEEALAQVAVSRPAMVICDLRLPDMDGMAVFDAIHKTDPALPMSRYLKRWMRRSAAYSDS
jgi:two-component system response regulator GlrR